MILHWGLLLLFLTCVKTDEENYVNGANEVGTVSKLNRRFSLWPSIGNGAKLMSIQKREAKPVPPEVGQSEGGSIAELETAPGHPTLPAALTSSATQPTPLDTTTVVVKNHNNTPDDIMVNTTSKLVNTSVNTTNSTVNATAVLETNETKSENQPQINLTNPGAIKRAAIVFGGFTLLAVAYFIFYRKKHGKKDSGNSHGTSDVNQFRYGVLQSEDTRDKMELSRVPLTMESEDEEDEDLEIFDLGQKKKSLSYVNLDVNDEDLVLSSENLNNEDNPNHNLLLDIEDEASDTLINWSSAGNKSVL